MNKRSWLILAIILIFVLFVACTGNDILNRTLLLRETGPEGDLFLERNAYNIVELPFLGLYSVNVNAEKIAASFNEGQQFSLITQEKGLLFVSNPFVDGILELTVPDIYTKEQIRDMKVCVSNEPPANKRYDQRDDLFLEYVSIQKEAAQNGSDLFKIKTNNFISLRNANVFVFDSGGDFIIPTYVTTNEGNTYTVETFMSARNASDDSSVAGALAFLKALDDHEDYLEQINPNTVVVEDGEIIILPPEEENTYYCAVNGDDANDGSMESPWRTPGNAVRQLEPGDTLIIREGEYILRQFPDDILIIPSGTAQNPIIVKGEGEGKTILKGDDNLYAMVILDGVSHVTISDMELTNNDSGWIRDGICGVNEPISSITLKNLSIHHIDQFGINFKDVEGLTVDTCNITYCGFGAIGGPDGDIGWRNCNITNSSLSYSGHYYQGMLNNPDLPYSRPDGIGLEPSAGPVTVEKCIAEHNRGDGIDLKNKNSIVSNCIVANNYADGIKLWGDGSVAENCLIYGTGDGDMQSPWSPLVVEQKVEPNARFTIKNCTIHDNPQRRSYSMYSQYADPTPLILTIINCTFSDSYGMAYFGENVDLTIKNSNFYAPNRDEQIVYSGVEYTPEDLADCPFGEDIISVDPQFINPVWASDNGNYKLSPNSLLIDAGTNENAPEGDLESTPRPQGAGVDIGAYEQ